MIVHKNVCRGRYGLKHESECVENVGEPTQIRIGQRKLWIHNGAQKFGDVREKTHDENNADEDDRADNFSFFTHSFVWLRGNLAPHFHRLLQFDDQERRGDEDDEEADERRSS